MNRRAEIALTPGEATAFLAAQPTVTCATRGHDGWPHLMPLWFVVRGEELWSWTYAKSQKVRNLEHDPRCTLQVEAGVVYDELRGLMLRCEARIHRDTETVADLGLALMRRYAGWQGHAAGPPPHGAPAELLPPPVEAMVHRQAPKRVALQFVERGRISWDHGKLG